MARPSSGLIDQNRPDRQSMAHAAYSRRVAQAKRALPVAASFLLLMVVVWPYLTVAVATFAPALAHLRPGQVSDVRMINPRYSGVDRTARPYTLSADAARQVGSDLTVPDALVSLERPRAHLLSRQNTKVDVTAISGIYQPQTHLLDLSGSVTLTDDRGYHFVSATARVDLSAQTAEGHDHVSGDGPAGTVEADGFRTEQNGAIVNFTGATVLHLTGAHGNAP